jgi:hypothetical protein
VTAAEFLKDFDDGFSDEQLLLLAQLQFMDLSQGEMDEEEISLYEMPLLAVWIETDTSEMP